MPNASVPVLGFAAFSGTGKTTLLTQLIPLLKQRGLHIGVIKHGHHDFDIDYPGKDSFRLRQAGASPVLIVSNKRRAVITEICPAQEPDLAGQLPFFEQAGLDLVLVEGFKNDNLPKIELHRAVLQNPLLYPHDATIIAVASDCPLQIPSTLPLLDLNKPQQIADFIVNNVLRRT